MIQIIKLVFISTLLYSSAAIAQSKIDSTALKNFWAQCIVPIIEKDSIKLDNLIQFPLEGHWGIMMGINEDGENLSKGDFFLNYDKLFTSEFIAKLSAQTYKDIEISNHSSELRVNVNQNIYVDGIQDEGATVLIFRKINSRWMLCNIQGVG